MRPMKSCVNGCNKPVRPPSKVLCRECFAKLDGRFKDLANAANDARAILARLAEEGLVAAQEDKS